MTLRRWLAVSVLVLPSVKWGCWQHPCHRLVVGVRWDRSQKTLHPSAWHKVWVLVWRLGRSCGGRNGNPLQDSRLGKPMDGGAWRAQSLGSQRVRHDWERDDISFYVTALMRREIMTRWILLRLWGLDFERRWGEGAPQSSPPGFAHQSPTPGSQWSPPACSESTRTHRPQEEPHGCGEAAEKARGSSRTALDASRLARSRLWSSGSSFSSLQWMASWLAAVLGDGKKIGCDFLPSFSLVPRLCYRKHGLKLSRHLTVVNVSA